MHFGRRINTRVAGDVFIDQGSGFLVTVRETHTVGDRGHDVWLEQVVHECVGSLDVFSILGNGDHVEEAASTFLGNVIGDLDLATGFSRAGFGLFDVTRVAHSHADVAVGQVGDVLGGVEVADRRTDFHEQVFGLFQISLLRRVGRQAQVMQRYRQHFGWRIEEAHAAAFQLGDVFRLHQYVPRVDLVHAQCGLDLLRVVADAHRAPHVREGVLVVRVADRYGLEQGFVQVVVVGQLGLVQLLVDTGLDLLGEEAVRRHDDVVAGLACQQLGFQGFVAVKNVVHHFDARLFFKVGDGVRCNVVGPVVNVQHFIVCLGRARHCTHQGQGEEGLASVLQT